jgi:hypothetical protein
MPSRESKITFGAAIAGEIMPNDKAAEAKETINFFESRLFIVVARRMNSGWDKMQEKKRIITFSLFHRLVFFCLRFIANTDSPKLTNPVTLLGSGIGETLFRAETAISEKSLNRPSTPNLKNCSYKSGS